MKQERVQKRKASDSNVEETNTSVASAELAEKTDQVVADIDDVLDDQLDAELLADMDDVLEADAEEFVKNYVQQGGE